MESKGGLVTFSLNNILHQYVITWAIWVQMAIEWLLHRVLEASFYVAPKLILRLQALYNGRVYKDWYSGDSYQIAVKKFIHDEDWFANMLRLNLTQIGI